jgi:glucose-6-phosphate isomerase
MFNRDAQQTAFTHLAHLFETEKPTLSLVDLFNNDPERATRMSLEHQGLHLDYSKNLVTNTILSQLHALAKEAGIEAQRDAMFRGEVINQTEQRAVLHTALRRQEGEVFVNGENIMPEIQQVRTKMRALVDALHQGQLIGFSGKAITSVLTLGIGGSFLGPKVVTEALKPYFNHNVQVKFVANVDAHHITETLNALEPSTTLVLIASKTFTTQETLANAQLAREWLIASGAREDQLSQHLVALTTNIQAASIFGVPAERIFPMWDWVGGRYSLWSAIGLPIAMAIGNTHFEALLSGGQAMDEHFCTAPLEQNMPVIMAMLGVWYTHTYQSRSHAVLPYSHHLRGLPAFLQQLDMESNGKSTCLDGEASLGHTGGVVWGGEGSNGQHAFHQLLHQGTSTIPVDFILPIAPHHTQKEMHTLLSSHCLAQSRALMQGVSLADATENLLNQGVSIEQANNLAPHKTMTGNRPSNTLLIDKLTPFSLGQLLALYEHKVFCQGVVWRINSFDQWGVELGKVMSEEMCEHLHREPHEIAQLTIDDSSKQLMLKLTR